MFRSSRWIRRLFLIAVVASLFAAVSLYIIRDSQEAQRTIYYNRATLAVQTAVAGRLFELTRTAEADLPQYRLVTVEAGEPLIEVATRYNTTLDVVRVANGLLSTVDFGDGSTIIVPEGVQRLVPPRSFRTYMVESGDTLELLAVQHNVSLEQLQIDNPTLSNRVLTSGDIIFIPEILN